MAADTPLILILDDDPDDRELLLDALSSRLNQGRFLVHGTPGETLAYFEQAGCEIPCLFLFDLNMPQLTGDELVSVLRKDFGIVSVPMFIVTTSSSPVDRQRCLEKGATGFYVKPPSYDSLVKLAIQLIEHCGLGAN